MWNYLIRMQVTHPTVVCNYYRVVVERAGMAKK